LEAASFFQLDKVTLYDRKCKFIVVQKAPRTAEKSDTMELHFMSIHRLTDPETSRFRFLASMQAEVTCAFKATHCMVEDLAIAHLEAAPCDPASCELVAHQKSTAAAKYEAVAKASPKSSRGVAGLAATLQQPPAERAGMGIAVALGTYPQTNKSTSLQLNKQFIISYQSRGAKKPKKAVCLYCTQ